MIFWPLQLLAIASPARWQPYYSGEWLSGDDSSPTFLEVYFSLNLYDTWACVLPNKKRSSLLPRPIISFYL